MLVKISHIISHRTISITFKEMKSSTVTCMSFKHSAINKAVNNIEDNWKITICLQIKTYTCK